ncbi:MAG: serine/threonine protein kinase, partial [Gemmatimonadaceae bacterium]|nr:serine/threonine protein kinase [Gemmatimonadaceae bacterium]
MTPLLQEQLEIVLRDEYRVLRELGGGGMSHVFLAEDVALGRRVVIKVLTPELAAGVNRERFQREIKLLATLQHPLLVPVLAAGEGDGLVWYSMPFVEGESLRERLRRGVVPLREALAIVVDVAQGLAEAHRRGVVHRDVKPENILLSGGRAVVADFGIAKALADASVAEAGLTASGIAVGTPAYMAPEQAAGDPDVDARADVYALGCVAYELLCGKPPFEAPTPGQLLMAHVVQPPDPLVDRAPQVGAAVSSVVMRALAKTAAERWQSAAAFAEALDEVRYSTSGETAARTAARPATPGDTRVAVRTMLALFAALGIVLAGVAVVAVQTGWAPRWARVAGGGMALAALAAVVVGPGRLAVPGARRLVRAGALAYGVLVASVVGHGAARAAGIGPFASLISSGRLAERDRILIAEFANRTGDTTLGDLIGEALRTDLAQSRSVTLVPRSDVTAALVRMERPGATLDSALAFDLAQREGVPAVLLGTIARLGKSVVISTRLVTSTGDELAGFREVAESDDDVIAAVDRLSKTMRETLGESLRSVASAPALETVTTGSLEALKRYTAALRLDEAAGGREALDREVALLEEAVRLDSGFAMAWRRLGVRLSSTGLDPVRGNEALARAYRLRDRLSPAERALAEAGYYSYVVPDRRRMLDAYAAVLAVDSTNRIALNNTTKARFEDGRF